MNPLQRASRNRKIIYFALIAVLFTVSMVWRGLIDVPLGTSPAALAQPFRWAAAHTIQSQAQRLEVWESDPNETEAAVSSTAMQLMTTGSRGIVVTALWLSAIDKQKRNDFHEFEQRVQMVTKLQPNFITPWIFQSWNITYNVSVEMQGSGDMYFYIVRGIQLLAEGERRNKRSPDMRYWIAFYYQNKFGVSDQVETLRCLYDLSCIPPGDRNPDNLQNPATKEVNRDQFRKFCERHPHLVRRLRGEDVQNQDKKSREKLRSPRPEDVIQFLRDNQKVPSRYTDRDDPKDPQDLTQFPVLPPKFDTGSDDLLEAHPGLAAVDDFAPNIGYFSAYKAARAWFTYSLEHLPPPMKDDDGKPLPGPPTRPGEFGHDPAKHRVPRSPMLIIFRQGGPRAQSYAAELEQKEGWFDGDGWRIDDPAGAPKGWWFPDDPEESRRVRPQDVLVGAKRDWSLEEWKRAAAMWTRHGKENGLTLDDAQLANLQKTAGNAASLPQVPTPEQMADEGLRRRYLATTALHYYKTQRSVTNFPAFLTGAEAEARVIAGVPITVLARKTLWRADQARKNADKDLALRLYKEGLEQWKRVLVECPNFHHLPPPDHSERCEEDTYEYELAYLRLLVRDDKRVRDKADQMAHAAHAVVPFLTQPFQGSTPQWPNANREEIKWFIVENVAGADFSSPFVGSLSPRGEPWVNDAIKQSVRNRQGLAPRTAADGAPPAPLPAPGTPGGPAPRPGGG
jgi:hypothetical protein